MADSLRMIGNSNERTGALGDLAAKMAAAVEYEQLLHLIHRLWRQARTRKDAFQFFPMLLSSIPRHPEPSIAFSEAVTWVDTFLSR